MALSSSYPAFLFTFIHYLAAIQPTSTELSFPSSSPHASHTPHTPSRSPSEQKTTPSQAADTLSRPDKPVAWCLSTVHGTEINILAVFLPDGYLSAVNSRWMPVKHRVMVFRSRPFNLKLVNDRKLALKGSSPSCAGSNQGKQATRA